MYLKRHTAKETDSKDGYGNGDGETEGGTVYGTVRRVGLEGK